MRAYPIVLAFGVMAACASGGAKTETASLRCAAIVADSLLGGVPVYPPCGVAREVRLISAPFRPQYTPPPGASCVRAEMQVVVDAQGNVVPRTARVIRSTDPSLTTAMMAALPLLRYEPATKDGAPVAQLHTLGWIMTVQAMPAAMRGTSRATRPRC